MMDSENEPMMDGEAGKENETMQEPLSEGEEKDEEELVEYGKEVEPEHDEALLMEGALAMQRIREQEDMIAHGYDGEAEDMDDGEEKKPRDMILHTATGALSDTGRGTTFTRKDGTVVVGGSKETVAKYIAKHGWSSLGDYRSEAIAYHEALKVERGVTREDGTRELLREDDQDDIKLRHEQHGTIYYGIRDINTEPAPGYTAEESIGKYVATDYFMVSPAKDLKELTTPVKMANGKVVDSDIIGPRIPVDRTIFDATEENDMATVERTLMFDKLINVPVTTPRLLSLLMGAPTPVVSDSFHIMRKYIMYDKVVSCRWQFDRKPAKGYLDTEEDVKAFEALILKKDTWLETIKDAPKGGRGESSLPHARNKKTGKKKKQKSRNFAQWFAWLPEWFKYALKNSIDGEDYLKCVHKNKNGVVPKPNELEAIMAEFGWIQYQHRLNYLSMEYERDIKKIKKAVFGTEDVDDTVAGTNPMFLAHFLELIYRHTIDRIRSREAFILRMNARYIPVNYWEWLMSPLGKAEARLITDTYRVPAFMYRKQIEAIRHYMVTGDMDEFKRIEAEGRRDVVESGLESDLADKSPRNEYDGVSLTSLSRLYEFINVADIGKEGVATMSQRCYDIMKKIERMKVTPIGDYEPDREKLKPLLDKLDKNRIPNFMRPDYLKTEIGRECENDDYYDDDNGGAESERKRKTETPVETEKEDAKKLKEEAAEVLAKHF